MPRFSLLVLVGLAGGFGTLSRYFLSTLVQRAVSPTGGFPWGTFSINILGCFLFGLVWALTNQRGLLSEEALFVILTGFMGAFTTFSTFIFDSNTLLQNSPVLAVGNITGQVVVGIVGLLLGIALGRVF